MTVTTCVVTAQSIVLGADSKVVWSHQPPTQGDKIWLVTPVIGMVSFGSGVNVPQTMSAFQPQASDVLGVANELATLFASNGSMEMVVGGYDKGLPHVVHVKVGTSVQTLNGWPNNIGGGFWRNAAPVADPPEFTISTHYWQMTRDEAVARTEGCIRRHAAANAAYVGLPVRLVVLEPR